MLRALKVYIIYRLEPALGNSNIKSHISNSNSTAQANGL
jgi:hypothetical protein